MNTRSFLSDVGCAEGSGNCYSNVTNALKLKVDFTFFFFLSFHFVLGDRKGKPLSFVTLSRQQRADNAYLKEKLRL